MSSRKQCSCLVEILNPCYEWRKWCPHLLALVHWIRFQNHRVRSSSYMVGLDMKRFPFHKLVRFDISPEKLIKHGITLSAWMHPASMRGINDIYHISLSNLYCANIYLIDDCLALISSTYIFDIVNQLFFWFKITMQLFNLHIVGCLWTRVRWN